MRPCAKGVRTQKLQEMLERLGERRLLQSLPGAITFSAGSMISVQL